MYRRILAPLDRCNPAARGLDGATGLGCATGALLVLMVMLVRQPDPTRG